MHIFWLFSFLFFCSKSLHNLELFKKMAHALDSSWVCCVFALLYYPREHGDLDKKS